MRAFALFRAESAEKAVLLYQQLLQGTTFAPNLHRSVVLILLGALYGLTDEWHQSFVPGREVSALDWLADLCGVTLGYLAASAPVPDPEPS